MPAARRRSNEATPGTRLGVGQEGDHGTLMAERVVARSLDHSNVEALQLLGDDGT